jgi:signal transduction histidine kinase
VTNVIRHAKAKRVAVTLARSDGSLDLAVRDDGIGFDVEAARARAALGGSLGLLGMQERVSLAGGRIEIDSAEGAGTEIRIRMPLTLTSED